MAGKNDGNGWKRIDPDEYDGSDFASDGRLERYETKETVTDR